MWNPFSILSFVYTIAKDAPDPVNVQYESPSLNLLPEELHKKVKSDSFFVAQLWIDNLSKRVLENIRINLTAPLHFSPIVRTSKRHGEVDYQYDNAKHELLIGRLDPSESLRISFFPTVDRVNEFEAPQIIVGEQELSRLMAQLGLYKKYPSLMFMYLSSVFMVACMVCALIFSFYMLLRDNAILFPNSDYTALSQAHERLKAYGCPLVVKENTKELQDKLTSGPPYYLPTILKINGVFLEEDLWKKEKIVYVECDER